MRVSAYLRRAWRMLRVALSVRDVRVSESGSVESAALSASSSFMG